MNHSVTTFLDAQSHPLREEIELLRSIILASADGLVENIKWNGPNYQLKEIDCVTLKINPPKVLQIIFHRGAKVKEQPSGRLINEDHGLLAWKENDRAVATFKTKEEILASEEKLKSVVKSWLEQL